MKFKLFDFLLPRETKFFDYMQEQAACFTEASSLLKEMLQSIEKATQQVQN